MVTRENFEVAGLQLKKDRARNPRILSGMQPRPFPQDGVSLTPFLPAAHHAQTCSRQRWIPWAGWARLRCDRCREPDELRDSRRKSAMPTVDSGRQKSR
jgi:hypothetical protein